MIIKQLSPDRVKADLISFLENQTGHQASISSKLDYSFSPGFNLEAHKIILQNKDGSKAAPLLHIDDFNLAVDIFSLLKKHVKVEALAISGLTLHFYRNPQGNTNWETLLVKLKSHKPQRDDRTLFEPASWSADNIQINNARLIWQDELSGQYININRIQFHSPGFAANEKSPFTLSADFAGRSISAPGKLNVSGVVESANEPKQWLLSNLDLRLSGFNPAAALNNLTASLIIPDTLIDLNRQSITVPVLHLQTDYLRLEGKEMIISGFSGNPSFNALVTASAFNLKNALNQWGIKFPALRQTAAYSELSFQSRIEMNNQSIVFNKLNGAFDNTRFDGTATIKLTSPSRLDFDLATGRLILDEYLPQDITLDKPRAGPIMTLNIPRPPNEGILNLNVGGKLRVNELLYHGISADQVDLSIISNLEKK